MSRVRSVDFLPEIFRTPTNKKFLSATLDQMIQEPKLKRTQGFIGSRSAPGAVSGDQYVVEPTKSRTDYQLDPAVVFKNDSGQVVDAITYPGMIDSLSMLGADVTRQDRLWQSDYYTWDPFVDLDKMINYGQYYWIPSGPDSVDVSSTDVPITDDFTVTRSGNTYTFSGVAGTNPPITLARGGSYNFLVDQPGAGFYIQAKPGVNGVLPESPNISSRDVLGVINNGEDSGTVTFNVPRKDAQNFYYGLQDLGSVDFATYIPFDEINNVYLDQFVAKYGGIDGITDLNRRTVILLNPNTDDETGGWKLNTQYDPWFIAGAQTAIPGTNPPIYTNRSSVTDNNNGLIGSYDTTLFDQTAYVPASQKYGIWQIVFVYNEAGRDPYLTLQFVSEVAEFSKVKILFGDQYSDVSFYKNAIGIWEQIPLLTAVLDELYYQDSVNPEIFGVIRLIEQEEANPLLIEDIIGKKNYVSPNGVTFTNGLKVQFRGDVIPSSYQDQQYYVEGVGTAIVLLPVTSFVTPETYTKSNSSPYDIGGYDTTNYDETLNEPVDPDYLTINRASPDLNAWTRSNRWFHIDVINVTAEYNNTVAVLDQAKRAKRPILEFRAGTRLWNAGTKGMMPVNIIDFTQQDAFSNVNGKVGYSVDGYTLLPESTIIFAADRDPQVRNRIYQVQFISPDGEVPFIQQPIINLVQVGEVAQIDNMVVVLSGNTEQGKSYRFDGSFWVSCQQKTTLNQPPLFDVFDADGVSLGNRAKYLSSTFFGTKLFSYKLGLGTEDNVLGFPLSYLSIDNLGDILFENNLYVDTFLYVVNAVSQTQPISIGSVRQYSDRVDFVKLLGWQSAITQNISRQIFDFTYNGDPLTLDIQPKTGLPIPAVRVLVDSYFYNPSKYTVTNLADGGCQITFISAPPLDSLIEVQMISDTASSVGYYQVPINLEKNPFNENTQEITLGSVRTHYGSICQNLPNIQGDINGANNTRDLGNILPYGEVILQQSSPALIPATWLRDPKLDITASIDFNRREYEKFKALILDGVANMDVYGMTPADILDTVVDTINFGKQVESPFYWTDTLPTGENYTENTTTVTPITSNVFDLTRTYDFSSANYYAVLVYLNGRQLIGKGFEYTVATDGPRLTIEIPLQVGDIVTIREYETTVGSYCPSTPSKLGLYPVYRPEVYIDTTYVTPTKVILGHDGSITVGFGDIRDDVLFEFEKRVYNNVKIPESNPVPLTLIDVEPGKFRTTEYLDAEITEILGTDFLSWVGYNKLDYKTQDYLADNEFTWNYSTSTSRLDGSLLNGSWRSVYFDYYDTDTPATTPWYMVGLSEKPSWWEERYGPAPYTVDNLVLWEDMQAGVVADPIAPYVVPAYARPGLLKVLPVANEGQLVSPFVSIVQNYDSLDFKKSWTVGEQGPVETAWIRSSSYPFSVMRLLALTKPSEFFSLFIDRDRYQYNTDFQQYLYDDRYRLDLKNIQIYGNGTAKHSYVNWTVDYNKQFGIDATQSIADTLANLGVQLSWRMASYSDKKYLKVLTEKASPQSQNTSLLIPDESYSLLLYRNQPFDEVTYSSIIVQITDDGYAVYGYSTDRPYFEISQSQTTGSFLSLTVNGNTYRINQDFGSNKALVPYGYVFTNQTSVVDFLNSYGHNLQSQGMIFDSQEDNVIMTWTRMIEEFINWSDQDWAVGSLINLNPSAKSIKIQKAQSVADPVNQPLAGTQMLDQNKQPVPSKDIVIDRLEDLINIQCIGDQTLNYVRVKFTAYEHIMLIDNATIFNDLIYDPITGARQQRLNVNGFTTYDWNGLVDAQGFILNQDNIETWRENRKYTKGQIVRYKDSVWSASTLIEPSQTFDFSKWIKSDYDRIQKGLLPNIATKSDQLRTIYDRNVVNLEIDASLLAFGLIGYRNRQYMQDIDLDDASQVNIYEQFLGTKGTMQATDLFRGAKLDKETSQYEIFENWAIKRAVYGANDNRRYVEFQTNQALLYSNPSTIEVTEPQQNSIANQSVLYSNLYKQSRPFTNSNIFPTTDETNTDRALPWAGYVNTEDVDLQVFDLFDLEQANVNLDDLGVGTTIWAAKINSHDWNVYRTNALSSRLVSVEDNLNGLSLAGFSAPHGLSVNDIIVVKYFNESIDGIYRVISVPDISSILISYTFAGTQSNAAGNGLVLRLETQRVRQASDITELSYANDLRPGNKVWVDNDGTGHWQVLEKISPLTSSTSLVPLPTSTDSPTSEGNQFGASIAQSIDNFVALIGAPGFSSDLGAAYVLIRNRENQYQQNSILQLTTANTKSFGNAVEIGNRNWGAVGAKDSDEQPGQSVGRGYALVVYKPDGVIEFEKYQLLVPEPASGIANEFGYSLAMSRDERWLYVGSPGTNEVHAYGRIDVQEQSFDFVSNGTTVQYFIGNSIQVDAKDQLVVTIDNVSTDEFIYNDGNVLFTLALPAGKRVSIRRRQSWNFLGTITTTGDGSTNTYDFTEITDVSTSGQIIVEVNAVIQTLGVDYTVSFGAANLVTFVIAPAEGDLIRIYRDNSAVAAFDLSPLYTVDSIESFRVEVNGIIMRPGYDYDFLYDDSSLSPDNRFLVFSDPSVIPNGCDIIAISKTYWKHADTIQPPGFSVAYGNVAVERFGHSVATTTDGRQILIGTPGEEVDSYAGAGSVYMYDRSVEKFTATTTSTRIGPVLRKITATTVVRQNGQILTNSETFVGGQYSVESVSYVTNGILSAFSFSGLQGITDGDQLTVKLNGNTLTKDIDYTVNLGTSLVTILATPVADSLLEIFGTVVILATALSIGDIFEIETDSFDLVQKLTSDEPNLEAQFGYAVDQCSTNCSAYVGAPNDNTIIPEGGKVERWVNQNRLYGTITGTNTSTAVLTAGNTLRINNVDVAVTTPPAWNSALEYPAGAFVIDSGTIYKSLQPVPPGAALDAAPFWQESDWIESYANDIVNAYLPNITASTSVTVINDVPVRNIVISVVDPAAATSFDKLEVLPGVTYSGQPLIEELGLTPLSWTQSITSPTVTLDSYAHFGQSVFIDSEADNLVVGAPGGTMRRFTTFDNDTTTFDSSSTFLVDSIVQSGAVYTFDLLPSANGSILNPAKMLFGQQMLADDVRASDQFGFAINYTTGLLIISSPGHDQYDSSGDIEYSNIGKLYLYFNDTDTPAWVPIRQESPKVKTDFFNSIYLYDRRTQNTLTFLDFIDPLQGKILGAARQNIDYIGSIDPASYNAGSYNNIGTTWREERLGRIWWDITNCRYLDYNQDNIAYRSKRWAQLFPGSQVQVYQWVSSTVPPAQYQGPGIPFDVNRYSISSVLRNDGTFETIYYFWATDIPSVAKNKTLSIQAITQYIADPVSSGIAYAAIIADNSVAIYNCGQYLSANDTILHVEYDQIATNNNVHIEYDLVAENNPDSFLTPPLYRKMQDSLCGVDTLGNKVPDPNLAPADLYGVDYRPRQSMFRDRFFALENYFTRVNQILAQYPIRESRRFDLLNSQEPEPSVLSGAWDKRVADIEELSYQDLRTVPVGYKYLVARDSTNNGLWAIYQKNSNLVLELVRVQSYDTRKYWSYVDWYRPGFSKLSIAVREVSTYSELSTINAVEGYIARVTNNAAGLWELYEYIDGEWQRQALQNGTIEISESLWNYQIGRFGFDIEVFDAQYFDQEPTTETRKIIQSINQELLIDDLAISRNNCLILLFQIIMTEQIAPEWLIKTSLVDVEHKIRDLLPFPIYRQDNQDFVESYLNEVKPYHVKVKQFNLKYDANDQFQGDITDFDVPAFYDESQQRFISPILDDIPPIEDDSGYPPTDPIWQTWPYSQWFNNYKLSIESVDIISAGSGYTVPPQITVVGDCVRPAEMVARVNSAGQLVQIIVLDPGFGYLSTAEIIITGGNGTGAQAVAVMGNQLVRSIKTTLKYDRYQYQTQIVPWMTNTEYEDGTLVRYNDKVYRVENPDSTVLDSGDSFNIDYYIPVPASELSGVDRTMGYYVPDVNRIGLDLALLISGIDYPGVQVTGPGFDFNPGFDSGSREKIGFNPATSQDPLYKEGYRDVTWSADAPDPIPPGKIFTPGEWVADRFTGGVGFDGAPFDNISYGPEGRPTYDPAILDAVYQSSFTDIFLGTRPTDINVDGGQFIDTYSSHAPEELVPGSTFDTLDFRVYTRPGADYLNRGFGWPAGTRSFIVPGLDAVFDWYDVLEYPATISVTNTTSQKTLAEGIDYTVDWVNRTIRVTTAGTNEIINIDVFGVGGGNQLVITGLLATELQANTTVVNVPISEIQYVAMIINGQTYNDFVLENIDGKSTRIRLLNPVASDSWISITVLGFEEATDRTWSAVISQNRRFDGVDRTFFVSDLTDPDWTNAENMMVEVNGQRLRPPEGAFYIGDGTTATFATSSTGDIDPNDISENDITVFVDGSRANLNTGFIVEPVDPSTNFRYITFNAPPGPGEEIEIYVRTYSPYIVDGQNLLLLADTPLNTGDVVSWKSFRSTRQQGLRTKVFQGPAAGSIVVQTTFDSIGYDDGPFDYFEVIGRDSLLFDLETTDIRDTFSWVTFNGEYLIYGENYEVTRDLAGNAYLLITGIAVGTNDIIAITWSTQYVVPEAIAFRVTQDMLGQRGIYRIHQPGTTALLQDITKTSQRIYVDDVRKLQRPNYEIGPVLVTGTCAIGDRLIADQDGTVRAAESSDSDLFNTVGTAFEAKVTVEPAEVQTEIIAGTARLSIGAEWITYRVWDPVTNSVADLRRGVSGTSAQNHLAGSAVYDFGSEELLPARYQDRIVASNHVGDNVTKTFVTDIVIEPGQENPYGSPVMVFVGGIEQSSSAYILDSDDPITVTLDQAPPLGQIVTIAIRRGYSLYGAQAGIPLQDVDNQAVKFLES